MSDSFRTVSSDLEMMINRAVESHRRITELETELAALRESARWVPVGERLPKKLGNVEIWRKMKDGTLVPGVAFVIAGSGWWVDTSGGRWSPGEVTHWRPMPAPPEPQAVTEKTGRECPNCDNDEVFSDGDDQFEGTLHRCEQCGKWAAISVIAGRYTLVDAPEPQAVSEVPNV